MPSEDYLDDSMRSPTVTVWLMTDAGATIHVESVCEQIVAEFPGAVISAQNLYAAKRLLIEQVQTELQIQHLEGTNPDWASFDLMLASNRRAEIRSGPAKQLAIPLSNGNHFVGEVRPKSIIFRGECQRSDATIEKLVRFLNSLNVGPVEFISSAK